MRCARFKDHININSPWTFINKKGEQINIDTSAVICNLALSRLLHERFRVDTTVHDGIFEGVLDGLLHGNGP
jgi:hypothetical protein